MELSTTANPNSLEKRGDEKEQPQDQLSSGIVQEEELKASENVGDNLNQDAYQALRKRLATILLGPVVNLDEIDDDQLIGAIKNRFNIYSQDFKDHGLNPNNIQEAQDLIDRLRNKNKKLESLFDQMSAEVSKIDKHHEEGLLGVLKYYKVYEDKYWVQKQKATALEKELEKQKMISAAATQTLQNYYNASYDKR